MRGQRGGIALVNDLPRIADELGQLRAEMKVLRARVDALRAKALAARANGLVAGQQFTILVKSQTRRTLLRDKLPLDVLNDPQYWKITQTETVVTEAVEAQEEFDVFEPF
ncbi:hypothetical protein [Tropicibacter sp. Alg240-R139]|uniref:hypothetical protein n=1 Tax=Tropicibacter sp. Alg240-R139 TaxID=2305991 RepID=UPI0013DFC9EA|nr:hypothetical protein [Tropicibacter sp. Alg240-R139]